jgi:hypothetical protein
MYMKAREVTNEKTTNEERIKTAYDGERKIEREKKRRTK